MRTFNPENHTARVHSILSDSPPYACCQSNWMLLRPEQRPLRAPRSLRGPLMETCGEWFGIIEGLGGNAKIFIPLCGDRFEISPSRSRDHEASDSNSALFEGPATVLRAPITRVLRPVISCRETSIPGIASPLRPTHIYGGESLKSNATRRGVFGLKVRITSTNGIWRNGVFRSP